MDTQRKERFKRSRNGCQLCKKMKIKCSETKPRCQYCVKRNVECDYSLKLVWGGRPYKSRRKIRAVEENNSESSLNFGRAQTGETQEPIWNINTPISTYSLRDTTATPSLLVQKQGQGNEFQSMITKKSPQLGMSRLEKTFDRLTAGEMSLQLGNVNILQEYILNTDLASVKSELEKSLDSYSEDLATTEAYLARPQSNFISDPISMIRSRRPYILDVNASDDDHEEEEDEEEDEDEDEKKEYENGGQHQLSVHRQQSLHLNLHLNLPLHLLLHQPKMFIDIPRSLQPLPSLLLEVPYYRNLMHFWVNHASEHLVPAPPKMYGENPFKVLLSQMAMVYPSVLTTLLAFAAKMRSLLIGVEYLPVDVIDLLLARSCSELINLLENESTSTSDEALATALLLSCYEIFDSKDFSRHRIHTMGARQIVMARSLKPLGKSPLTGSDKNVPFFLLRWFVYMDVIGALSATQKSEAYLPAQGDIEIYEPVSTLSNVSRSYQESSSFKIDPLMGFELKLLTSFAQITVLARKAEAFISQFRSQTTDKIALPADLVSEALSLKDVLHNLCLEENNLIIESQNESNSAEYQSMEILKCTNTLFSITGIIHLYRRVLQVPRDSPLVQNLAYTIGKLGMDMVPPTSTTGTCCIFCFFTAACETLDPSLQIHFEYRFRAMSEKGNINAKKGLTIMRQCWASGDDWIEAARRYNIDFALF